MAGARGERHPVRHVRIDNTGGGRPSYFGGSTPQLRWAATGKTQGESLDLVRALDAAYPDSPPLWPPPGVDAAAVDAMVSAWRATFPRSARPSSRAAFLFSYDGAPLPLSTFSTTLEKTEQLLATHTEGPFFTGGTLSAADVAWAPFLERYAAQLPCLHEGLIPRVPGQQHLPAAGGVVRCDGARGARIRMPHPRRCGLMAKGADHGWIRQCGRPAKSARTHG